jgi:hypothetical protein
MHSKRRPERRSANINGIAGPQATLRKPHSLLTRAQRALAPAAECAADGLASACHAVGVKVNKFTGSAGDAVVSGGVVGGLWVAVALVALVLFIVALVRKGQCPLSVMAIFMIILTFVFPPAGLVLAAIGVAKPGTMCA